MRKLHLQVQISLDGYIAGPNGEMDWMVWNWDEELKNYVAELTASIGCILLGRNLAQGFIPHWATVAADTANPEYEAGKIFHEIPKVIFTKTLESPIGEYSTLAKGELRKEVEALKNKDGKDLMVYGGGSFVSALIAEDLIDNYYLFVNPVILGKGMPIFQGLQMSQNVEVVDCFPFSCGISLMHYRLK
jgi:dihydrofolate reductase